MKYFLLTTLSFILVITTLDTYALTTTWDGASWSNGDPDWTNSNDVITISGDLSITFDVTVASITINNGASLTINGDLEVKGGGDNLTLTGTGSSLIVTDDVTFNNGSSILVSDNTFMNVGGNLINKNNSDDFEISGSVSVTGDLSNGNGSIISNPNGTGSLTVGGTISNSGTIGEGTIGDDNVGSLPVTLSLFEAARISTGVEISWTTVSELNNSHFEVLRSYDLIDFEVIKVVEGAGTSNLIHEYQYLDDEALGTVYYKLRQVDFDGQSEEFETVKVAFILDEGNINAYPNPTSNGSFNLFVNGGNEGATVSITVVNMKGAIVFSEAMVCDFFGQLNRQIALSDVRGVLTLIIQTDESTIKKKLVSL